LTIRVFSPKCCLKISVLIELTGTTEFAWIRERATRKFAPQTKSFRLRRHQKFGTPAVSIVYERESSPSMELHSRYLRQVNVRQLIPSLAPRQFAPFPIATYTDHFRRAQMIGLKTFRAEIRPTLRLAIPLVLAELGWMSMALVDTMMVGRLSNSAVAISAVSLGGILVHVLAFFGGGLLFGLDTLVSQAFGAGQREDCHRSLLHGIYLSLALTPLLMAPVWFFEPLLRFVGISPDIIVLAVPYSKAMAWGTLPLLLYFAVRRCMQGMNIVRPIAFALITANIINAVGNWLLIYGKLGAPAMGAVGSGWSTAWARIYLAAVLVGYLLWYDREHRTELLRTPIQPELARIRRLITLGFPAAMQITLEIGVFALVTALIGRLGAISLASHQIALNTVSFTYMVPLGISSAAAVRVGQAIGRRDPSGASAAGDSAIFFGAGFMTLAGLALLVFPRVIARIYTPDETVIRNTVLLLAAGAAFQLFDGIQTVATGALRGAGDTRTPMLCHFTAYWIIGLPLGAWLCFRRDWGAFGLWSGLSLALILIGIVLLFAWRRTVRTLIETANEAELVRN
jgi:multidrug resistance protein, MATE family